MIIVNKSDTAVIFDSVRAFYPGQRRFVSEQERKDIPAIDILISRGVFEVLEEVEAVAAVEAPATEVAEDAEVAEVVEPVIVEHKRRGRKPKIK